MELDIKVLWSTTGTSETQWVDHILIQPFMKKKYVRQSILNNWHQKCVEDRVRKEKNGWQPFFFFE